MNAKRLETSRLFHRFGFGPRPGEYAAAIKNGLEATRSTLLTIPEVDLGASAITTPLITDLGKCPQILIFYIALAFISPL